MSPYSLRVPVVFHSLLFLWLKILGLRFSSSISQNVRLAVLSLAAYAAAQQAGTYTPGPPKSTVATLFHSGGCVSANTSIVLDSNYRWLHGVGSYTNCVNGVSTQPSALTLRPAPKTAHWKVLIIPATVSVDLVPITTILGLDQDVYERRRIDTQPLHPKWKRHL